MTPSLQSGKSLYGITRFLQDTSLGSGAMSVIQRSGSACCWEWETSAAPNRVLNVTKATGNSYMYKTTWDVYFIQNTVNGLFNDKLKYKCILSKI